MVPAKQNARRKRRAKRVVGFAMMIMRLRIEMKWEIEFVQSDGY
jgi:hypothetical protein